MKRQIEVVDMELEAVGRELLTAYAAVKVTSISQRQQAEQQLASLRSRAHDLRVQKAGLEDALDRQERQDEMDRLAFVAQRDTTLRTKLFEISVEESNFWFRRFVTTVGVANTAAFLALASGFLQAGDHFALMARVVPLPMTAFVLGMTFAGVIPVVLSVQARAMRWADTVEARHPDEKIFTLHPADRHPTTLSPAEILTVMLSGLSAAALLMGIMFAIGGIRGIAAAAGHY